jgi:hypothetical protein
MAIQVPYQPQNVNAEQADGNILVSWTGSLGAAGYQVQRSTDGVNFTTVATLGLVTQYLDVLPGTGIMYFYLVIATNTAGSSPPSSTAQMVAAPPSEMSLFELRLRSQQTADRVNSQFVTTPEWNSFLRLAMYELYDLLVVADPELFVIGGGGGPSAINNVTIATNGSIANYPLPNGTTNFLGGTYPNTVGQPPIPAFYKMWGMDLNVNTSNVTPSRVTLLKFMFIERNKYVYSNSTSTIYGVYNMRYRVVGQNSPNQMLNIIPTPAGGQTLGLWYVPKLPALLQDTDLTSLGYSGWLRYVIVRAAKYALDKEESSTDKLDAEIGLLRDRINEVAQNRDAGIPDVISNTRQDPIYGGNGFAAQGGSFGGW